ncbi:hypothetical protein ARMSODRAFT_1028249 [Armillaria solidipes]|uniref:Uncharacterized protein n=1 Tax=Armillaria solidipes TaxID=1076256 RepID=A0A2H3ANV3_9AGAR|nr:hypothetical protein ARMSODRAFT_1028249 [Armillaria solidipes]
MGNMWYFVLPNGESARVILLEYIEGIALDQLQDKYPIHDSPRYNPLLKGSYTGWIEITKKRYVPAVRGICSTSSTNHSGHSMVVSKREHAFHLANACPAVEHVVSPNGVQWRHPSPSLLPLLCSVLAFDNLFVKRINPDVPLLRPRKVVPVIEQRLLKGEQFFVLNYSEDDESS